jgi:phosphatidylglycerophosphate synthase
MEAAHFDWIWTYVVMLMVGGLTVLFLHLITPPRVVRVTGTLPGGSPNWISIIRVPVTLLGLFLYFSSGGDAFWLWLGFELTVIGMYMDRLDGKVAKNLIARLKFLPEIVLLSPDGSPIVAAPRTIRAPLTSNGVLWAWYESEEKINGKKVKVQRRVEIEDWINFLMKPATRLPMFELVRSEDPAYPGLRLKQTRLGGCIDPISDKLITIPVFIYQSALGMIFPWTAALMILSDLFSTIMRWPFDRVPGFRRLQKWIVTENASYLGKTKYVWQTLTMLATMPAAAHWLHSGDLRYSRLVASSFLILGVLTGIFSNISRTSFWQQLILKLGLQKANRNFAEVFEHKVAD